MNERQQNVAQYCDGVRTSKQISELSGETQKYVQHVFLLLDLPRRKRGSAFGELNGSYKSGRKIDRDGYALVSAPPGHPYARYRKNRNTGIIYEHRLVVENKIGRLLLPSEIVDHIDGLRLHNCPSNLRVFDSNAEHLTATITGQIPNWSQRGIDLMNVPYHRREDQKPVRTYNQKKKRGDARLIQILLAALQLGIDSPYLLGTHHHLTKAGILSYDDSSLQQALENLYQKYA